MVASLSSPSTQIYGLTPLPPTSLGLETRTLNMRPTALGCSKFTCGGRADHNVQVPVEIEAIFVTSRKCSKMHQNDTPVLPS